MKRTTRKRIQWFYQVWPKKISSTHIYNVRDTPNKVQAVKRSLSRSKSLCPHVSSIPQVIFPKVRGSSNLINFYNTDYAAPPSTEEVRNDLISGLFFSFSPSLYTSDCYELW